MQIYRVRYAILQSEAQTFNHSNQKEIQLYRYEAFYMWDKILNLQNHNNNNKHNNNSIKPNKTVFKMYSSSSSIQSVRQS